MLLRGAESCHRSINQALTELWCDIVWPVTHRIAFRGKFDRFLRLYPYPAESTQEQLAYMQGLWSDCQNQQRWYNVQGFQCTCGTGSAVRLPSSRRQPTRRKYTDALVEPQ